MPRGLKNRYYKISMIQKLLLSLFLSISILFIQPVLSDSKAYALVKSCFVTKIGPNAPEEVVYPAGCPTGGGRANVTCTGTECAYKYITNYVRISSRYGPRSSPGGVGSRNHGGIDLAGARSTPIKALEPGVVLQVKADPNAGPGYAVEMRDMNGRKHYFMHFIAKSALTVGQQINAGDEIGLMDSTGSSTGDHLHYQISQPNGDYADPDVVLVKWPVY